VSESANLELSLLGVGFGAKRPLEAETALHRRQRPASWLDDGGQHRSDLGKVAVVGIVRVGPVYVWPIRAPSARPFGRDSPATSVERRSQHGNGADQVALIPGGIGRGPSGAVPVAGRAASRGVGPRVGRPGRPPSRAIAPPVLCAARPRAGRGPRAGRLLNRDRLPQLPGPGGASSPAARPGPGSRQSLAATSAAIQLSAPRSAVCRAAGRFNCSTVDAQPVGQLGGGGRRAAPARDLDRATGEGRASSPGKGAVPLAARRPAARRAPGNPAAERDRVVDVAWGRGRPHGTTHRTCFVAKPAKKLLDS
jgi:hypothetical protein